MRHGWSVVLAVCLLLPAAAVAAAAPLSVLPGFKRTIYAAENGAPPNVITMAQSRDGYLWLGTSIGLYRFDGQVFERMRRFERSGGAGIGGLWAAANGDLWIGYGYEGVALLRRGALVALPTANAPELWTKDISETPDGAVWILNGRRIHRFRDGAWSSRSLQGLAGNLQRVLGDRQGRVWVMADEALLLVDPETLEPQRVSGQVSMTAGLAADASGQVWVADPRGLRPVQRDGRGGWRLGAPRIDLPASLHEARLSRDRRGHLWIAGASRALLRFDPDGAGLTTEPIFETPTGSPAFNTAVLEDREGNLWLGNALGIERYSRTKLVHHSATDPALASVQPNGLASYQVLADGRGVIYVRIDFNLWRIGPDGRAVRLPHRAGPTRYDRVCPSRDGGLWVRSGARVVERIDGPRPRRIPLPNGPGGPPTHFSTCVEDGTGNLWAGLGSVGFSQLSDQASRVFQIDDQRNSTPFAVGKDWEGRVLAYRGAGALSRQAPDAFAEIVGKDRSPIGFISAIHPQQRSLLLGGEIGFGRYDGRRLDVIPVDEVEALQDASGIAQTAAGETWMLTHAGVLRMKTADLEARLDGRTRTLPHQLLDHDDGLAGTPQVSGWSNVAQAADGRLWFATNAGIFSLHPAQLVVNNVPPPVTIKSLTSGGRQYDVSRALRLPAGTGDVQIDFTALSLSVPGRVRFLYRLTGNDSDWVDPGPRREAVYTNLKPGKYRFQVIAANNDGVWNREGASLDLEMPPTFVQSRAFLALLAALMLLLAWVGYTLQVRRVAARLRARLEDRLRERERIARELHDTLLQSVQGLIFQFQGVADSLPGKAQTRRDMVAALDQADAVLREGRDRVVDLRGLDNATDPVSGLAEAARRNLAPAGVQSEILVEGRARPLAAGVAEELTRLAEEALTNVARHASARKVDIVLGYGARTLSLGITDDGVGMDESIARDGRADHFGLVGMRERAERLDGRLDVLSRPGAGTSIRVTVPQRSAYRYAGLFAAFRRSAPAPPPPAAS